MDRSIRRALYTVLVAGGLVVVGASTAHAAGEGLLDPVTQGTTETSQEAADTRGDPDAPGDVAPPAGTEDELAETPAEDFDADTDVDTEVDRDVDAGLVGDIVGRDGILDSLVHVDVAGVVDGTLGENGLVSDLLGVPPTDIEVPLPEVPLPEEPGTEEPGTEEPGTEEPGTEEPGTEEPGTEEPGTEEPGTEEPGTEEPGVEEPGVDLPGTTPPGSGHHPGGSETPRGNVTPTRLDHDVDSTGSGPGKTSGRHGVTSQSLPASAPDAARDLLADSTANSGSTDGDDSVDIGWGDDAKPAPAPSEYDGTILPGGLSESLHDTLPEPAEVAEPVVVPGTANIQPGHLITGQLSLISLLLGLGIAVLRLRRR
ncbi:hypothetical protein AB1046_15725 [Promicromonospora sp. Populi]|uniref:hypothetical protein n=1 Tax=Promicromonospora sp. Populi TaxID=3239420 RepID=UPI0034E26FF1